MKNTATRFTAVLLVLGLTVPGAAFAASASANLSVTATVDSVCTISIFGVLAFGAYDPTAVADKTGTGTVRIKCTKGTQADIGLGLGLNASGSIRRMVSGAEFLTYEMYKEGAHTNIWGDLTTARLNAGVAANNGNQDFTVHGNIVAGQNVTGGFAFSDTVAARVDF